MAVDAIRRIGGEARLETAFEPSHGSQGVSTWRPDAVAQWVVVATDNQPSQESLTEHSPPEGGRDERTARKDALVVWGFEGVADPKAP